MKTTVSRIKGLSVAAAMALASLATPALSQTSAPTSASLNATSGPLSVSTASVLLPVGFGGGTIYYPTVAGKYGVIAISPGFTATQSSIAWLGRRIATHGFVVIPAAVECGIAHIGRLSLHRAKTLEAASGLNGLDGKLVDRRGFTMETDCHEIAFLQLSLSTFTVCIVAQCT